MDRVDVEEIYVEMDGIEGYADDRRQVRIHGPILRSYAGVIMLLNQISSTRC